MAEPGLDEITTTTARNRKMDSKEHGPSAPEQLAAENDFTEAEYKEAKKEDREFDDSSVPKTPNSFSRTPKATHGFGHPVTARDGHLRNSGHSGAHRIGKK